MISDKAWQLLLEPDAHHAPVVALCRLGAALQNRFSLVCASTYCHSSSSYSPPHFTLLSAAAMSMLDGLPCSAANSLISVSKQASKHVLLRRHFPLHLLDIPVSSCTSIHHLVGVAGTPVPTMLCLMLVCVFLAQAVMALFLAALFMWLSIQCRSVHNETCMRFELACLLNCAEPMLTTCEQCKYQTLACHQ